MLATVYAEGKIQRVEAGQRAGDFLPDGAAADLLIVSDGVGGMAFVKEDYLLKDGDKLVVTPRGVAG